MNKENSIFFYMKKIQDEYLELLLYLKKNLTIENLEFLLDEVKVFWDKRKNKIHSILSSIISDNLNIGYLTCATQLDVDDNNFLSFLLYGDHHIFDDPLPVRLQISTSKTKLSSYFYEKTIELISDNIRVIGELDQKIWIIPVRYLYSSIDTFQDLTSRIDDIFISLFDGITSMNEYFQKCTSVEDINMNLNNKINKTICLSEQEPRNFSFIQKFNKIKHHEIIDKLSFKNDAEVFYFQMRSYILQALDIIFTSVNSRLVPFIRFKPAFLNFQLLVDNFQKVFPELNLFKNKSYIYYLIYRKMDVQNFDKKNILFVISKIEMNRISNKIDSLLLKDKLDISLVNSKLDECLLNLYESVINTST